MAHVDVGGAGSRKFVPGFQPIDYNTSHMTDYSKTIDPGDPEGQEVLKQPIVS